MRKVKLFFKGDEVIFRAIKQVTLLFNLTVVNVEEEADLIVIETLRHVEDTFNKSKHYILTPGVKKQTNLPDNVHSFEVFNFLTELLTLISEIEKDLPGINEINSQIPDKIITLLPNAKKILVIDDTSIHRKAAHKQLAGHDLTVAMGYEEAMEWMSKETFEVVLTDLHLPMSYRTLSDKAFKLGKLVEYGLLLMLEAAKNGAKHIAVVTDLNHHSDPFSAAFDHFSHHTFQIESAKTMLLHAHMVNGEIEGEYVKDWKYALDILIKNEEE